MADLLGTFVSRLGLRSSVFGRVVLVAPWGLRQEKFPEMMFHILLRGRSYLSVGGGPVAFKKFEPGDFILFPHGTPHAFASSPKVKLVPAERICYSAVTQWGDRIQKGAGKKAEFICGSFALDGVNSSHLVASLPEVIEFRARDTTRHRWIRSTLELLANEVERRDEGSSIMIKQLLDSLFVQILRWCSESEELSSRGVFAALRDAGMMRALELLTERYHENWTIDKLAKACGFSRTVLATRFRGVMGEGVATFLRSQRLHKAELLLTESDRSIKEIAYQVGFASPEVFIRNFEQLKGVSPQRFRMASR